MKKTVKNSIVFFLVGIVAFSTMGVSVNTLYCFCTGEREVSVFEIEYVCKKTHDDDTAEIKFRKLPPCCQKALACHKADGKKDCTKKSKTYLKADLKFLKTAKAAAPNDLVFIAVQDGAAPVFDAVFSFQTKIQLPAADRAPPRRSGRDLLNFIQIYRC